MSSVPPGKQSPDRLMPLPTIDAGSGTAVAVGGGGGVAVGAAVGSGVGTVVDVGSGIAVVSAVGSAVKRRFGYTKVRYRGLAKNTQRLALLLGFANLMRAERYLAA